MRYLLLLPSLLAPLCAAQELPHPQDMGLSESRYAPPDPADYQLSLNNGLVAYVARAGHVPLVTMSAFVRAGKVNDQKEGAAETLLVALQDAGPAGMGEGEFKEFPVPKRLIKDGEIAISFDRPDERGVNWRFRSRISDVWLLKR